jgi:hypothetical protein
MLSLGHCGFILASDVTRTATKPKLRVNLRDLVMYESVSCSKSSGLFQVRGSQSHMLQILGRTGYDHCEVLASRGYLRASQQIVVTSISQRRHGIKY